MNSEETLMSRDSNVEVKIDGSDSNLHEPENSGASNISRDDEAQNLLAITQSRHDVLNQDSNVKADDCTKPDSQDSSSTLVQATTVRSFKNASTKPEPKGADLTEHKVFMPSFGEAQPQSDFEEFKFDSLWLLQDELNQLERCLEDVSHSISIKD